MKTKVGWVLTVLPCLLLLFSGVMKLFAPITEETIKGMAHTGVPLALIKPLGVLEVSIAVICLIPRTLFVGAILLTGWAGGAIMTHLRVGDPFFIQPLLPIVLWIGVGLRREAEIAPLLGFRRRA